MNNYPELTIDQQDRLQVQKDYLKKHNIEHELTARLIQERPDDIREFLSKEFRSLKKQQTFFSNQDFGNLFDCYNFTQETKIDSKFISEALKLLNIHDYTHPTPQVNKQDFIDICHQQYLKHYEFK